MTSVKTQLPYEYYTLPFCQPEDGDVHYKSLNLGTQRVPNLLQLKQIITDNPLQVKYYEETGLSTHRTR